jgi:precorrin-2 dehydrogenase/sirohydrochlorin ferrochelatase
VAERKVGDLLESGARVRVVSPEQTEKMNHWEKEGSIELIRRGYQRGDLAGAMLAIAATNDPQTNSEIQAEAKEQGVLLNAVDDPAHCDFIVPSQIHRDDVTIAISTGGQSPALSRKLRRELEKIVGPEYGEMALLLSEVRTKLKERKQRVPADRWQKALDGDALKLMQNGQREAAKEKLLAELLDDQTTQTPALEPDVAST